MRLDKFLKVSRLIKRRTVANEACDAGESSGEWKACKGIRKSESGRCDRDSVRYKNGESRSAGYSGYDQERRGEKTCSAIYKNRKIRFFRYKINTTPHIYRKAEGKGGKCMGKNDKMPGERHIKLIVNNRKTSNGYRSSGCSLV